MGHTLSDVDSLLEGLNLPQREAVTFVDGPLLILAGAGSGKTRVITHRVAYLIAMGIEPERILALTFTNKAAQEMKERVLGLLGSGVCKMPFLSTFHSFGLWVLRRFAHHLGYSLDFNVYDDSDQLVVVRRILRDLEVDEKRFPPKGVLAFMSMSRRDERDPETLSGEGEWGDVLVHVYKRYRTFLRDNDAVDFDDLILLPLKLLEHEEAVREFLQKRFLHIMVDEYQDTNTPQYKMVKIMALEHRNLCVVGDDDQSIYSWRGADVRNIFLFEKDFPEARMVKLEENYRSTQIILEVAWSVIRENTLRKEKRLFTANPRGEKVVLYLARNEKDEAGYVVSKIQELAGSKPLSDFAVFYRINAQSRPLEEVLAREGIPYRVVGGLRFYDRKEVKDIVAYLRLVANEKDELAFRRVVNAPKRGIGEKSVERVLAFCRAEGLTLWEGLRRALDSGVLSSLSSSRLLSFVFLVEELRETVREMPLSLFIDHLMYKTGYRQALEMEDTVEAQGRLENLKELINVALEYNELENGLQEFIDRASLATSQDERGNGDMVALMTLHSAKGLEFPVVFIVGVEEGFLPHSRSLDSLAELEEERRLCYVGITRAQEMLYISHARSRLYYGRERIFAPSRFLQSIPGELLDRRGLYCEVKPVPASQRVESLPGADADGWRKGDRVVHSIFGAGQVEEVEGAGSSLKLRVNFDRVGKKVLAARYAKLKRA